MPITLPASEKSHLRRLLRQRRSALPFEQRRQAELRVAYQARAKGLLRRGQRIAAYVPVGSEFSSWPLILLALKLGVQVFLPQTPQHGKKLTFVRLDQHSHWLAGGFGIPEPQHAQQCAPQRLHTVFMPLLGFDNQGGRLGQGGGFYDATFAFRRLRRHWLRPRLVGLAYACQRELQLPIDRWDVRLDQVLTGE